MIEETGHFTEDIATALEQAATLSEIDDIYRPYRPKRKAGASVAKAKGLNHWQICFKQNPRIDPIQEAAAYCSDEQEIATAEDAFSRCPRYLGRKNVRRSKDS